MDVVLLGGLMEPVSSRFRAGFVGKTFFGQIMRALSKGRVEERSNPFSP